MSESLTGVEGPEPTAEARTALAAIIELAVTYAWQASDCGAFSTGAAVGALNIPEEDDTTRSSASTLSG